MVNLGMEEHKTYPGKCPITHSVFNRAQFFNRPIRRALTKDSKQLIADKAD
jgi:hypothetical protein